MNEIVYTVGHSAHPLTRFIRVLDIFAIERIVDVRTIPRSRHHPQFNEVELKADLRKHGIDYIRLEGLRGPRRKTMTTLNTAWEIASLRGYVDYMQTPEFTRAMGELIDLAKEGRIALMCAEAAPWRCHRSLISDALLMRNMSVEDIFNEQASKPHVLTAWVKVDGKKITYPGSTAE